MAGHFGHKGGWSHAWLGIDLQPDDLAVFGKTIVVTKVGPTDAAATDCLMRP